MFPRIIFSRISSALRPGIRRRRLGIRDGHNFQYFRAISSAQPSLNISGIFPPLATPFDENENISWEKLEENMNKWNKIDFRGYIIGGSNGEPVYLNWNERVEMVKKAKQFSSPDKLLIAGSGCESTRDTILMTKAMAEAGADAVMVVTPSYFKSLMNNQALEQHYLKLADQSPVPVILYSVPGNTTIELSPEVIIRVSAHPNIIGIKDSGGDVAKLGNLVYKADKDFQILAGSVSFMYPAMTIGCVGAVSALAHVLGEETCELYSLVKQGKAEEAKKLQQRLVGPNAAVTKKFGVPGLKAAMDWFGFYGGPPRSPLQPIGPAEMETLKQMFRLSGFQPEN